MQFKGNCFTQRDHDQESEHETGFETLQTSADWLGSRHTYPEQLLLWIDKKCFNPSILIAFILNNSLIDSLHYAEVDGPYINKSIFITETSRKYFVNNT